MDDAELVAAAAANSSAAFAEIYDRYVDRIYDYARSVLRSDADAADVAQDTFLAASQRLEQLRDPSALRPWLYAIARSHSFRILRDRKRLQTSDDVDEVAEVSFPDDDIDARELVWSAAAGLTASDRDILDLHLRQGLDGQELATALGVTANVANAALHRVRSRLEQSIGAVLLAKTSKKECPDLDALMVDGLNPLARKRITRHIDQCDICGERRRVMTAPSVLFSATPLAVAPLFLRSRVLDSVGTESAIEASNSLGWQDDGFPVSEPLAETAAVGATAAVPTRRYGKAVLAAGTTVILIAGAVFFVRGSQDPSPPGAIVGAAATTSTELARILAPLPSIALPTTSSTTEPTSALAAGPSPSTTLAAIGQQSRTITTETVAPTANKVVDVPTPPAAAEPGPTPATTTTSPATTTSTTTSTTTTTTSTSTTEAVQPPNITLINFTCSNTMTVVVNIDPLVSVSGAFQTSDGSLSTPLLPDPANPGRFSASLSIGEGSIEARVVASGPGGTDTLQLGSCIVID